MNRDLAVGSWHTQLETGIIPGQTRTFKLDSHYKIMDSHQDFEAGLMLFTVSHRDMQRMVERQGQGKFPPKGRK